MSDTKGFTLIELLIAITIGAILMIFVIAPYNFYSEKSRARLSSERVVQSISKARTMIASGYAPEGKNVDMAVLFKKGSDSIESYTFQSTGSGGMVYSKNSAQSKKFETIPLESGVTFSRLPLGGADVSSVVLVFRAPTGSMEIWDGGVDGINLSSTSTSNSTFSGGVVGYKGLAEGARSAPFLVQGK